MADAPEVSAPSETFDFVYFFEDGFTSTTHGRDFETALANEAFLVFKAVPGGPNITPHVEVMKSRFGNEIRRG